MVSEALSVPRTTATVCSHTRYQILLLNIKVSIENSYGAMPIIEDDVKTKFTNQISSGHAIL